MAAHLRPVLRVLVMLAMVLQPRQAAGQDPELDGLLLMRGELFEAEEVSTRSLQFYRVPIGFTFRDLEQERWGLRVTLPISFGLYEARATTDLEDLFERLRAVTVTPGLELHLRAGERWQIKPFGEVGVGSTTAGTTEVLFAAGFRAAGRYTTRGSRITLGLGARYASDRSSRTRVDDYTTLEAGIDLQAPLGFELGSRQTFGGLYGVARAFPDLSFAGTPAEGLEIRQVYEVGLSFSTEPVLEIWKIRLPWIAVGYRFGDLLDGIRVSFSFPF